MDNIKNWPVNKDEFTTNYYENGYLRITAITDVDGWILASTPSLQSVYIEATITAENCSGTDHYGVMFRVPVLYEADRGYLFGVSCDGQYSLRKWDATIGEDGEMIYLVRWTPDSNINVGSYQTNRVGIMTIGDRLIMFANGVQLGEFTDDTFSQGYFGVFLGSDVTENLTVKIQEVSYWDNPTLPY